jgi:transposase
MFSVPLELPEFKVIKQEMHSPHYTVHVEKKEKEARCPQCGFFTSFVHDRRTRKVRDLCVLNKPLYLLVCVKRYKCENCQEIFTETYESIMSRQHYTNRFRLFLYEQVLGTTIQDVSRKHGIAYSTVERIFIRLPRKRWTFMKNILNMVKNTYREIKKACICKGVVFVGWAFGFTMVFIELN